MDMTRERAEAFASRWADAWNRREVADVLQHCHEDIVFASPTALAVTGSPVVRGREALGAYWSTALGRIESLRFTVDHVLWDSARRELAIIYTSEINGATKRVSENLTFSDDGQVVATEVFHGIPTENARHSDSATPAGARVH